RIYRTAYSDARQLIAWVLGLGGNARIREPGDLAQQLRERAEALVRSHTGEPEISTSPLARDAASGQVAAALESSNGHQSDAAIRPERFARLVTLASILIDAGRAGRRLSAAGLREALGLSDAELREDISLLNVVNFG